VNVRNAPPETAFEPSGSWVNSWAKFMARQHHELLEVHRFRDCGARVVEELRTYEYGERSGVLEDLGGHRWELSQTVRDTAPEEWGGTTVAPW
jgi:hypothetical protein